MCIECSLGATFNVMLCIKDRKVWKAGHSMQFAGERCPTCGEPGKSMGFRWRPPRLTNKAAWARIETGDYLWELPKPRDQGRVNKAKKKPEGFGRYVPLEWRRKFGRA